MKEKNSQRHIIIFHYFMLAFFFECITTTTPTYVINAIILGTTIINKTHILTYIYLYSIKKKGALHKRSLYTLVRLLQEIRVTSEMDT